MSDPLTDLQYRVTALEQEMAQVRAALPNLVNPVIGDPAQLVPMLRQALASPKPSPQEWDELLRRMGITRQPIGAEKLQEFLIAEGIDPNSNEFSRDLIAHRED